MAGILTKDTKLYYKTGSGSKTQIHDLQSTPEMGVQAEKVDKTTLENANRTYVKGIGDVDDLEFGFLYDNSSATSNFRVLKGLETAGTVAEWTLEYPDGTTFAWSGQVSCRVGSNAVNDVMKFTATITVASDFTITNPTT